MFWLDIFWKKIQFKLIAYSIFNSFRIILCCSFLEVNKVGFIWHYWIQEYFWYISWLGRCYWWVYTKDEKNKVTLIKSCFFLKVSFHRTGTTFKNQSTPYKSTICRFFICVLKFFYFQRQFRLIVNTCLVDFYSIKEKTSIYPRWYYKSLKRLNYW